MTQANIRRLSIQQALRELSLTEDRIATQYTGIQLVRTVSSNHTTVAGQTIEAYNDKTKEVWQSVTDLREQRLRLRQAILQSNATTKVIIGGQEMTVAFAIAKKKDVAYDKMLLATLSRNIAEAISEATRIEASLNQQAIAAASAAYGPKADGNASEFDKIVQQFMDRNKPKIIGLKDYETKRDALKKELDDFDAEVDWKLTESNVNTFVEIKV